MRILYITQWFEPEPILKGVRFVEALAARGHDVETATGFPNYPAGKLYPGYRMSLGRTERMNGVEVRRLPLYPSHDRSSARRILNYFSFAFSAALFGSLRARRFDILYVYPPIPAALAAAWICMLRQRPFVMDIQDLWPDSVVSSGMSGVRWMERLIGAMCNFAYRRAERIVVQSEGIGAKLVERGVDPDKIDVIYNWAYDDAPRRRLDLEPYRFEGRFNIVYAGNLGRVQGLEVLIHAAVQAAKQVPNLQLLLIGNGVEADALRALVADLGTPSVRIAPPVAKEDIADVLEAADVLALHLLDDPLFDITIPHKVQAYLAAGRPILAGVAGEAARIVTDADAGLAARPGKVDEIAMAMVRLAHMSDSDRAEMGRRGLEAFRKHFELAVAAERTEKSLRHALATWESRRRTG